MELLWQILTSAIADLVAAGLLLAGGIAIWWCASAAKRWAAGVGRGSAVVKDEVLSKALRDGLQIKTVCRPESSFVRVLSEWERDFLIEYYNFTTGRDAYDGRCLRLDQEMAAACPAL